MYVDETILDKLRGDARHVSLSQYTSILSLYVYRSMSSY